MTLTQEEYLKYKQMGYSDDEINQAIKELQQEQNNPLMQSYSEAMQKQAIANSSNTLVAATSNQDNLVKWQLELDSLLERIEHILRGDKPTMINGNMVFIPAQKDEEKIFNSYGVAEIMRILSMYLNRNTILSNYDEKTILWKVLDFGYEVSDLIYLKYEEMGLNTLEKRKRYPMIVRELVDSVHSSYLRALNGGERDSLRQARTISQSEAIMGGMPGQIGGYGGMKQGSVLNPINWFKGRRGFT